MKKITFITPFGAEERLDNFSEFLLAQGLVRKGYNVSFYTYRLRNHPQYSKRHINYKGVPVFRCMQKWGMAPGLFFSIIKKRPKVIVLCHIRSYLNFCAFLAARMVGAKIYFKVIGLLHDPYVVTDRDDPLDNIREKISLISSVSQFFSHFLKKDKVGSPWENFLFHFPLFHADKLIVISEFEKTFLKKVIGRDAFVLPWGVPLQSKIEPEMVAGGERYMADDFLLFIGQVKKRKGWDVIIKALSLLKKEGIFKNLIFVTSSSLAECKQAEEMADRHDLSKQIYFLHNVSNAEKRWLYKQAMTVLVISRYEGFGLPVFEAFVEGTPLLATDIPVFSDFLTHEKNALISQKGNAYDLAKNIKRIFNEKDLREIMVAGGKEKAKEYTDDIMLERFLALL